MAETGRLEADPLFLGLTRPPMMLGVTYSWFMLNALTWAMVFINTSDFGLMIPGGVATHFIGYMICSREPRFMDIWMVKMSKCSRCKNSGFHHNTQSYDLY
jgi:type IV secretion system protein VirB3